MTSTPDKSPLRLRKRHGDGSPVQVTAADGARLVNAQSLRQAIVASIIVTILFSVFWTTLTALFDQRFPWFTVVFGYLLGYAIRVSGRGLDWRFPLLAAFMAITGSAVANIIVAASVTADGFDVGTLQVLRSVTSMTWPVFFEEKVTIADTFFAVIAAQFAAFLANRKLTRSQYHAVRLWKKENNV